MATFTLSTVKVFLVKRVEDFKAIESLQLLSSYLIIGLPAAAVNKIGDNKAKEKIPIITRHTILRLWLKKSEAAIFS